MKGFRKILYMTFIFLLNFTLLQAQQDVEESQQQIELPDLTAIVESDVSIVGLDALPDFSNLDYLDLESASVFVKMPEVKLNDETTQKKSTEKFVQNVFVEGKVGVGLPFSFVTDFTISSLADKNPGKIILNYDTCQSYNFEPLNNSFADSALIVEASKELNLTNFKGFFDFQFTNFDTAFQNRVEDFYSYKQNYLQGKGDFKWIFPKNFGLDFNNNLNFYNKFATENKNTSESFGTAYLQYNPDLYVYWQANEFNLGIKFSYDISGFIESSPEFDFYGNKAKVNTNRESVGLKFSWKNDIISTLASVDFVFADYFETSPILVPFIVAFDFNIPVYVSPRPLSIGFEGGLKTKKTSIWEYEKQYKFTHFDLLPGENSQFYGKVSMLIPVQNKITGKIDFNYEKQAFDNGDFVFDLLRTNSGLYAYKMLNNQYLSSDIGLSYSDLCFSWSVLWHSNWMDLPVCQTAQEIQGTVAIQNRLNSYGASGKAVFYFGNEYLIPKLDLTFFAKISKKTKLNLEFSDFICLLRNKNRNLIGEYINRGGNILFSAQFQL